MGKLHGHEMKVKYYASFIGTPMPSGGVSWGDFYSLDFAATVVVGTTEGFDAEMYRRAFVEAMENIAKLEKK